MTEAIASSATRAKDSKIWARDPHDFYVEPEWTSARLFDIEKFEGNIVDPSCGLGRIVRSAIDAGYDARGYDLVNRSAYCLDVRDFTHMSWPDGRTTHNIISNPPFKECGWKVDWRFIRLALQRAERKVALLLPTTFDCGGKTASFLETTPLRRKLIITPRPSMPPGAVIQAGEKPGGGTGDFAWFVWLKGYDGPREFGWLHRDKTVLE